MMETNKLTDRELVLQKDLEVCPSCGHSKGAKYRYCWACFDKTQMATLPTKAEKACDDAWERNGERK